MAQGSFVRQDNVVCRFFLHSTCRDGDSCLFVHDRLRNIPDSVCRYYLRGICAYGKNCVYDHPTEFSRNDSSNRNTDEAELSTLICNTARNEIPCVSSSAPELNWINAPEFVPRKVISYADAAKANTVNNKPENVFEELCPLYVEGECPFEDKCQYVHGNVCDLCNKACLHPRNEKQRKIHNELCAKEIEQDMEFSFAVQRSRDKTCGICMEVVWEKEPLSERRFGILDKCNHIFCLSCIRQWRRSRRLDLLENALNPVVTRACPECRIASNFIIPSVYFVDTEEEKTKVITEYKKALSKKPCKYFKRGEGTCPFGGACFYLHAKSDGTKVELPLPTRRRRYNQDGVLDYTGQNLLWDFFDFHQENILINVTLAEAVFPVSDTYDGVSDITVSFD